MWSTGRGEQKREKMDNITAQVRDLNVGQNSYPSCKSCLTMHFGLLRLDMSRKKINS